MSTGRDRYVAEAMRLPLVDEGIWRTLQEEVGEDLELIAQLYLEKLPERLTELERLASRDELEELKLGAHQLKGSSRNLGALRLAGVCQALEQLSRSGEREAVGSLLSTLAEEAEALRNHLGILLATR